MQTWTWWPRGPIELHDAEMLLCLLVEDHDWDGLAGLARCLIEMLRASESRRRGQCWPHRTARPLGG